MRLVNNEQQPVLVAYTENGAPKTGLTPTIIFYKASDGSNVTPQDNALNEIGSGLYKYAAVKLPAINADILVFRTDGGSALADKDRYKFGCLLFGGYPNELLNGQESIGNSVNNIESKMVVGSGTITVNHNYGGTDNLIVLDEESAGIENANIYAYLKSDWEAGRRSSNYCKGWSMTDGDGRWSWSIFLEAGVYYLIVDAPGFEQQNLKEVNVL